MVERRVLGRTTESVAVLALARVMGLASAVMVFKAAAVVERLPLVADQLLAVVALRAKGMTEVTEIMLPSGAVVVAVVLDQQAQTALVASAGTAAQGLVLPSQGRRLLALVVEAAGAALEQQARVAPAGVAQAVRVTLTRQQEPLTRAVEAAERAARPSRAQAATAAAVS
jgi:hypothetical protein